MKNKKLLLIIMLALVLALGSFASTTYAADGSDIVILYENDVHCAVDGYSKLAAMKKELSATADHVGVVSSGDFVQGGSLGSISQGEYIVKLMNIVGYDAVALGNHEFDYRIPRLMELADMMDTKPVCGNFKSMPDEKLVFKPYSMVSYGDTDIAYIGITTPDTLTSTSISQFMDEKGSYIYSFSGDDLFETVQQSIDAAKADGADYIIALSHLGTEFVPEQWSAQALVKNTAGFDAVLDAHSHSVIESMMLKDKNGDEVIISSTGTKFANIGKLTVSDGKITTELIKTENYDKTDAAVDEYIAKINEEYQKLGDRVIGTSKIDLITVDKDGKRIIRHLETNLGDLCADAFRIVTDSDIGVVNGGGLRGDIAAGDITFNDLLTVCPWNNTVCAAKATGQQIIDLLELGVMYYPGENGGFQHVSGLTFKFDSSIPSSVKLDENTLFVSVDGPRRVYDVKVLDKSSGEYKPIELDREYILASHNHLLVEQGSGASMFKDANLVLNNGMLDVELLEQYIVEQLGGVVDERYAQSQNRIVVADRAANPTTGVELDLAA
ncbi:MAG: bifunctional metallophosphatase/5'-nucleotidase [Oscillospiraceae bacterium]|nr:bifunctional metallophosphatase/5'-nucleotidase [Oscillospiraceae bacterium]